MAGCSYVRYSATGAFGAIFSQVKNLINAEFSEKMSNINLLRVTILYENHIEFSLFWHDDFRFLKVSICICYMGNRRRRHPKKHPNFQTYFSKKPNVESYFKKNMSFLRCSSTNLKKNFQCLRHFFGTYAPRPFFAIFENRPKKILVIWVKIGPKPKIHVQYAKIEKFCFWVIFLIFFKKSTFFSKTRAYGPP